MEWLFGEGIQMPGGFFGIGYNFEACMTIGGTVFSGICGPVLVGLISICLLFGLALLGVLHHRRRHRPDGEKPVAPGPARGASPQRSWL